ncbi:MAG: hypothetical protein M3305_04845 [Actinomycetota bacterium]|nr:hypothetical protein [Actinomycetota bacterium]
MSSGWILKPRHFEGIPAVVHGDDPATSDREHGVGLVLYGLAEEGPKSWGSGTHHDPLADPAYLLQLCLEAVLGPAPEYGLYLLVSPADPGLGLGEVGIQVRPFHVRIQAIP